MTHTTTQPHARADWTVWIILFVMAVYAFAAAKGIPQRWTQAANAGHAESVEHRAAPAESSDPSAELAPSAPPIWAVTPFVLLLAAIALLPLIPQTEHWWEGNLNRFLVAAGLALVTLAYYAFVHERQVESHWPGHAIVHEQEGAVQFDFVKAVLGNAILQEYIPFIVLLFSLYTIAGGIRISGDLEASPTTNAAFLGIGAALASLIGTTGAAMLLIRPLLETNRERKRVAHTVIFFIFSVCNCGGCLLPIGDPPLFLGYLQGVDFLWTLSLWPEWLFVNGMLLVVYWLFDHFYHHPRETKRDIQRDVSQIRGLKITGLGINGPLLAAVVLAVALLDPTKSVPGTTWHPWMYLREVVQLGLIALSLAFGPRQPRRANGFNYDAIIEVAALFIGIFICMQPALEILHANGPYLVERFSMGPAKFFWATGSLSSVLDNAPTYLVFFQTAQDPTLAADVTGGVPEMILVGISLGAVFGGAMTYIGNGPNFMVKAIAEKSGVRMPSFFGYVVYSVVVLLPILALMDWIFILRP
jgi:Na+/H+ antiporter NhaD/arsenite permease-like protein